MTNNHVIDYTENTFYQSFSQQSFATRIARWIKAFAYSFIALVVFSMILEELQNFCITPPGLFLQFLFLLIISGIIEFISLQMSNVSDHCILDYAKNLVTVIQVRFFIKKVSVLASFEQIRVIGVSAAPQSAFSGLFSKSDKNYALVIMNYRNRLIHITEHDMSLEDANNLALELSNRHMPSARLLQGERDTELVADAMTGDVSTRPVRKTLATTIDSTILPALQAFCGLMLTAAIISLAMLTISRISTHVFDTDIMVAHQPVNQLFIRPSPRPTEVKPASGAPLGTVTETASLSADLAAAASQPAIISASPAVEIPVNSTATQPATAQIVTLDENTSERQATETVLYKASERIDTPASQTMPTDYSSVASPSIPATVTEPVTITRLPEPEPAATVVPVVKPPQIIAGPTTKPALEPIVPVQSAQAYSKTVSKTMPIPQVMSLPVVKSVQLKLPEVKANGNSKYATHLEPEPKASTSITPDHSSVAAPAQKELKKKVEERNEECSVLAGHGLHPLVELGDQSANALKRLGKPIAEQVTGRSKQYVFSGFSFASDVSTGVINQITVTRKTVKQSTYQTPQNFAVGSPIASIKSRFGPPAIIDGQPGLHFPQLGISFIPSPHTPDSVGAIKIYPAGSRPD